MKIISIEKAIGKKIEYDLTKVIPEQKTKKIFKKGYIVRKKDIEELKDMGKYNIIINRKKIKIHENKGSHILAKLGAGSFCKVTKSKEGKTRIISKKNGIIQLNKNTLKKLNLIDGIIVSCKKKDSFVEKGQVVAVFGITPLEIEEKVLKKASFLLKKPLFSILPLIKQKIGLIVTGTEIYEGRIKDAFADYIVKKLEKYKYKLQKKIILPDKKELIEKAILNMIENKFQIIFISGGMSVDANDVTKKTIENIKNIKNITYGSPVLPGAMFLISYFKKTPIIGLPAGLLNGNKSILDFILPLILTQKKINKNYIAELSNGGLLY